MRRYKNLCIHNELVLIATESGCILYYRGLCTGGEGVSQTALATVLTVIVESHEDTSTTLCGGTLATEAFDLAVGLDLVVLQDRHFDLLTLMLDLLGSLMPSDVRNRTVTGVIGTGSRCRSSSSSSWHHHGDGGPSEE